VKVGQMAEETLLA